MQTPDRAGKGGEWLKGSGPESDIVLSSRIRLARNISDFPFPARATDRQRQELCNLLRDKILECNFAPDMTYVDLTELSRIDLQYLTERQLISREHMDGHGKRGVAYGQSERLSLMVNEEDHIRMHVIRSGLELKETWEAVDAIDRALEKRLSYAFSPQLGYLAACPTNVGTGMRVSVMLHLPALAMTKQMEKVFRAVAKLGLTVRGMQGEGTQASSDLYQISNQISLGKSETELMDDVGSIAPVIVRYERLAREHLLGNNRNILEDRVWRAYGMLKSARCISSQETLIYLSQVRMGVNLGLIQDLGIEAINELFILTQPGHLQKLAGKRLKRADRDIARATFIRSRLGGL